VQRTDTKHCGVDGILGINEAARLSQDLETLHDADPVKVDDIDLT